MTTTIVDIGVIKRLNKDKGFHFFDPESMRFFNSRSPQYGYQKDGKIYFVTSEKFDHKTPRYYTVRVLDPQTGDIDTLGEFNKLTRSQAQTQLNKIIG